MRISSKLGLKFVAFIAVFALVVAACSGDDGETTTAAPSDGGTTATTAPPSDGGTTQPPTTDGGGTTPPPAEGATFRIGMIANITTDNWWAALDTESSSQNQAYLTSAKPALFTLSLPGFVLIPNAAASEPVTAVQEGDVWTVTQPMRDDILWSDGTPVTANDFEFYFDVVREFSLGSNHSANFPPAVLDLEAVDATTLKVTFDSEPGLAVWNNGVGLAAFPQQAYWEPFVQQARDAAQSVRDGISDEDAVNALVEASLADDDPENDVAAEDVTAEDIEAYKDSTSANEGLTVLYGVTGDDAKEPSASSLIYDQWEQGAFAATLTNPGYFDRGTENTLFSDGAFQVANTDRGDDNIYGGAGGGDVIANYVEGPYVGEILWVEHGTKDAAYEKLEGGELDFVYDPTGLTSGLRNQLAANPSLQFSVNQTEGFRYMAFNMRKAPMNDLAFRQALATVINKELIAETVLAGAVIPGYTVVHPELTFWSNPDAAKPGFGLSEGDRFDLAIQILKDAGYTWDVEPIVNRDGDGNFTDTTPGDGLRNPDGSLVPELTLLAPGPGYDPFRATFSIWVEQWANDLGIPLVAEPTDFNAIVDAVFPPQTPETATAWDMYMLGWGGGDPSLPGTSSVAFFHSREDALDGGGFNTPGFKSDAFDAAADNFEAATTLDAAQQYTFEMEEILQAELPYVVLFRTPIIEAFDSKVAFPAQTIMGGHQGFPTGWPNAVQVLE